MTRQVTTLPCIEKSVANGNWDTTRTTIDRIIIHTMVGPASAADARFNNSTQKVSAHYGVLLDGTLWHWVDEDNTAYHAGEYSMNQRSIGIEHEDNGDYNGVRTDALYAESSKLVADICKFYSIPVDRTHILKHSEVIATGCPDALDIDRIVRQAQALSAPEVDPRIRRDELYNVVKFIFGQLDLGEPPQSGVDMETKAKADIERRKNDYTSLTNQFENYKQTHPTVVTSTGPSTTTTTASNPVLDELKMIINSKWTWFGVNGWKNRLTSLRKLI